MLVYTPADEQPESGTRRSRKRWHSVAIVGTSAACERARAEKDHRYLSTEAPRLPLSGCDAACCDCTYRHFDDRRRGSRRTSESGAPPKKPAKLERREARGRREID